MLGKLNVAGAFQLLTGKELAAVEVSTAEVTPEEDVILGDSGVDRKAEGREQEAGEIYPDAVRVVSPQEIGRSILATKGGFKPPLNSRLVTPIHSGSESATEQNLLPSASLGAHSLASNADAGSHRSCLLPSQGITPSATSNKIYALGTVGYDFGTEARRDSFKQLMPAAVILGVQVPANPYNASQMANYLDANLYEGKSLIWTLNIELTPIYALQPVGAFAEDIYKTLQNMLAGEVEEEDNEGYIERVSITGRLSDKTVKLFSGQILPVVKIYSPRGMYGWTVNMLIDSALASVSAEREEAEEEAIRKSLRSFLQRVYYDLRNLGQADRDRAINFAATNAFQSTASISKAVAVGMELHSIEVEKSPFCPYNSNCWDVKLKFFNPDNTRRAKKVYRFTIDVSDLMPVTLR
ncbi:MULTISPECIES: PatA/PatG family cyanobactin maturation protease [unclassified Okeania]|uniref:PatA/PatG family cyanobactin maturation protease n=1 Tax=unclassified Okeania TaxID=2634635 RepID=UPI0033906159